MHLAIVIVILLVWAGIALKEKLTPSAPPIKDLDEHTKYISSLPNQKARQKYLKNRKHGDE